MTAGSAALQSEGSTVESTLPVKKNARESKKGFSPHTSFKRRRRHRMSRKEEKEGKELNGVFSGPNIST